MENMEEINKHYNMIWEVISHDSWRGILEKCWVEYALEDVQKLIEFGTDSVYLMVKRNEQKSLIDMLDNYHFYKK